MGSGSVRSTREDRPGHAPVPQPVGLANPHAICFPAPMDLGLATRQPDGVPLPTGTRSPRGLRRSSLVALALIAAMFLVGALISATPNSATLFGFEGPSCPSRWVPGLREAGCPGCGLTRGTALLLDGQFRAATAVQPAAWLVVGFALAAALLHAVRVTVPKKSAWTTRLFSTGRVAFLVGLVLVWAIRI